MHLGPPRDSQSGARGAHHGPAGVGELLPFAPKDHDVRIVRATWIYYVRGVRKSEPLRSNDFTDALGIVEVILSLLMGWVLTNWWDRQTTWKVGVLRYPDTALGGRIRILHRERLPDGEPPAARIAELVIEVNHGRLDVA
jgi:hypothetical protein